MKNKIFTLFAAAILSISAVSAQALTGTYFLDNSLMRTRLNPAFSPRSNYFGIPVLVWKRDSHGSAGTGGTTAGACD